MWPGDEGQGSGYSMQKLNGNSLLVPDSDQILHKALVGLSVSKIPAASHPQRLIECVFEAKVGLLHIPVLMCDPSIVGGWITTIMSHELLIAYRPLFSLFFCGQYHCTECGITLAEDDQLLVPTIWHIGNQLHLVRFKQLIDALCPLSRAG